MLVLVFDGGLADCYHHIYLLCIISYEITARFTSAEQIGFIIFASLFFDSDEHWNADKKKLLLLLELDKLMRDR